MKWRSSEILIVVLLAVAVLGVYGILYRVVSTRKQPAAPVGSAEVLAPAAGLVTSVGATLDIQARAAGAEISRLEFWADDAPLYVSSRSTPAGSDWWAISGQWTVGWAGMHRLYVRAFSSDGIIASQPITVAAAPAGQMAFASNRDGPYALYRTQLDGGALERLFSGTGESREPSSNGQGQLVFSLVNASRPRALWQFDLSSGAATLFMDEASSLSQPAWSPGGQTIAFVSNRSGREQIWVADADGSNARRLTDEPTMAHQPAWSGDGTRLVYTARREENLDIYRLALENGKPARLTRAPAVDWQPAWSPTAEQIAFVSNRDGAHQIYTMDTEGNNVRQLTDLAGGAEQPRWSPDGKWLLFVAHGGRGEGFNDREIYVMRADGRDMIRLTDNAFDDTDPLWLPPANATPTTPQPSSAFAAAYFANMTLTGAPAVSREEGRPDFDWGTGGPGGGIPADHFSARWTGTLTVDTGGDYLFDLLADDGARLFLDDVLLLDMWGQRGRGEGSAPARLEAGVHTLRLEYYENEGQAGVSLNWARVGD